MVLKLEWTPEISVNNKRIDDQHKKLFSIINQLVRIKREGGKPDKVLEVLKGSIDYSNEHFKMEELYMSENKYPLLKTHMDEHLNYLNQMEKSLEHYVNGVETLTNEFLEFMVKWWLEHVSKSDMNYARYVNS